jgi:phage protein D
VKAWWNNIKTGQHSSAIAGLSSRAKVLRIQRGIFDFKITLAYGRADLTPQRPARVSGYKLKIDEHYGSLQEFGVPSMAAGYFSQLTLETEQAEGVEGQEGAGPDTL